MFYTFNLTQIIPSLCSDDLVCIHCLITTTHHYINIFLVFVCVTPHCAHHGWALHEGYHSVSLLLVIIRGPSEAYGIEPGLDVCLTCCTICSAQNIFYLNEIENFEGQLWYLHLQASIYLTDMALLPLYIEFSLINMEFHWFCKNDFAFFSDSPGFWNF